MSYHAELPSGHPARRKEIVEAARAIAAEIGWRRVTVRAIATRIGCSAPSIYQYFQDKSEVLTALAVDAEESLGQAITSAVAAGGSEPVRQIRQAARAWWDFAMANSELYAVIFGLDGLTAYGSSGRLAPEALRRVAAELSGDPAPSQTAADDLSDQIAATAHGFIALAQAHRFPGGTERAAMLFLQAVDGLLRQPAP